MDKDLDTAMNTLTPHESDACEHMTSANATQKRRIGLEALLFVAAVAIGIYGLGQGLTGLFLSGQPITLAWLAVAGFALYVLSAQMARVHDSWPHRAKGSTRRWRGAPTIIGRESPVPPESR